MLERKVFLLAVGLLLVLSVLDIPLLVFWLFEGLLHLICLSPRLCLLYGELWITFILILPITLLLYTNLCALSTVRVNECKCQNLEQINVYCRAMQGDGWFLHIFKPQSPQRVSAKCLKGKMREGHGWLVQIFGVIILCCAIYLSGHEVPVNLQQDKYYSLFCNF